MRADLDTYTWHPESVTNHESPETGMLLSEVMSILNALRSAGCRVWIAGGWAVDALVGHQTRVHRDLDLALDADHQVTALQLLHERGYVVETDWRPVRLELAAPGRGWVDLHPVSFVDGVGLQADLTGGHFTYPAEAFTEGALEGARVQCLSREQQISFRSGYELREVDKHDLDLLRTVKPLV